MKYTEQKLLECAVKAARESGTYAQQNRGRRNETVEEAEHDIKIQLDLECQHIAEDHILQDYPNHSILGEENRTIRESNYQWIIDPIDGTINFFHGLEQWCCAIAVQYKKKTVAAVVYLPDQDLCFTATHSGPALCNETTIEPSSQKDLKKSLLLFGLGKPEQHFEEPISSLERIHTRVQNIRIQGSAAIDICMVSCGRADAYIDNGIFIWDVAAAQLIAERSGSCIEVIPSDNKGRLRVCCSNPFIHAELCTAYFKKN